MPYRDDRPALEARRDDLRREVAENATRAEALRAALGAQEATARELAEVEAKLDRLDARRASLLEDVRIASPCSARWEDMRGDERARFCGQCEKTVYDLSSLSRSEAEALLVSREGAICVRLFRRVDGTVLTADCPVGARRKRVRLTVISAAGAGALIAAAVTGLRAYTCSMEDERGSVVMGDMAPPPESYVDQPLMAAERGVVIVFVREARLEGLPAERWHLMEDGSIKCFRGELLERTVAPTDDARATVRALKKLGDELQSEGAGAVQAYADSAIYQRYSFVGAGTRRAGEQERAQIFELARTIVR